MLNIIFLVSIDMIVNDSLMSLSIIFGFLAGVIVIVSFMADPCFREYIRVKKNI